MRCLLLVFLCLSLAACANFGRFLQDRNARGCYEVTISGGGGMGGGVSGGATGVLVTGEMDAMTCLEALGRLAPQVRTPDTRPMARGPQP